MNNEALFNVYAMYYPYTPELPEDYNDWDIVECSLDEDSANELQEELEDEDCFVVVRVV